MITAGHLNTIIHQPHLEDGIALQQAAVTTFSSRQGAVGAQIGATLHVQAADKAACTAYGDFRKMAHVAFKTDADRARFIHQARAGFEAALTPDYAQGLARRGFPTAILQAGLALLDALVAADEAQIAARAATRQATAERRAAVRRLDDWFIEFRDTAKIALRHRPDWVALLKIR